MYVPNNRASIYRSKNYRTTRRKRQIHNYSWRFQRPSISNCQIQQPENQDIVESNSITSLLDVTFIDYFIQQRETIRSSQADVEYSLRQTTFWVIKHTLINIKKWNSHKHALRLQWNKIRNQ